MTQTTGIENYTERDYPGSSIRIVSWTDAEIISINVFVGADRSALSKTFALGDREAAATHYAFVQNGARAGRTEAALIADLARTPVAADAGYRSIRHGARNTFTQKLTDTQRVMVDIARRRPGRLLGLTDCGWLTLRAIVDKGYAEIVEREDGRATGRILSIRVHS